MLAFVRQGFFMTDLKQIGVLVKPHGLKGEMVVKIDVPYIDRFLSGVNQVFLLIHGTHVPYAISKISTLPGGKYKVLLAGVDSHDQVNAMRGVEMFVNASIVSDVMDEDYTGYEVIDKVHGSLGKVSDVISGGMQDILLVEGEKGSVMIPLVKQFVVEVDGNTMHVNLPEGMIDL